MKQTVRSLSVWPASFGESLRVAITVSYASEDGPPISFEVRLDANGLSLTPMHPDATAKSSPTAGPITFPALYGAIALATAPKVHHFEPLTNA